MTTFLLCAILGCVGVSFIIWARRRCTVIDAEIEAIARERLARDIRGMLWDVQMAEARRAAEKAKEN